MKILADIQNKLDILLSSRKSYNITKKILSYEEAFSVQSKFFENKIPQTFSVFIYTKNGVPIPVYSQTLLRPQISNLKHIENGFYCRSGNKSNFRKNFGTKKKTNPVNGFGYRFHLQQSMNQWIN